MPRAVLHVCICSICQSEEKGAIGQIHHQMNVFLSQLNESQRRWYAALESTRRGHGGDRWVAQITGLSEKTIRRGRRELKVELAEGPVGRIRHPGGGRPPIEVQDPELEGILEQYLVPETAGNPQGRGKYKRSSLRQLSTRLGQRGHPASAMTVRRLLRKLGYSLRGNVRRKEAKSSPPERNVQFEHIQEQKSDFLAAGEPVISVDTKKRN